MFFDTWWQGIIFGVFSTIALLVFAYAFTVMWKPYEEGKKNRFPDHHGDHDAHDAHDSHGCQAHH